MKCLFHPKTNFELFQKRKTCDVCLEHQRLTRSGLQLIIEEIRYLEKDTTRSEDI